MKAVLLAVFLLTIPPLVDGAECKGESPCKACKDCSKCRYCSPKNPQAGSCGTLRDQDAEAARRRIRKQRQ